LRGGHVGVACRSCHGPFPGQPARFKGLPFGACTDCHEDAHLGQLKPIAPAKVVACDTCHTVGGFTPARYELEKHAKTQFPLAGAHVAAACRGCHPVDDRLAALVPDGIRKRLAQHRRPERFSFVVLHPNKSPQACADCHKDVHQGQFLQDKNDKNDNAKNVNDCAACHKTTSFADLSFDHEQSRFPLVGKHKEAACAGCHKTEKPAKGSAFVRYKPLGTSCGDCHTDIHQGQFLAAESRPGDELAGGASGATSPTARDCDFCHETTGFKKTLFEHDNRRFTTFALEGKHAKIPCARCHPEVRLTPTITTVRYRPIPRACEDCHVDYHHGTFRGFEP
jgi:hypothetical protein